jgi:hypothetical protein
MLKVVTFALQHYVRAVEQGRLNNCRKIVQVLRKGHLRQEKVMEVEYSIGFHP